MDAAPSSSSSSSSSPSSSVRAFVALTLPDARKRELAAIAESLRQTAKLARASFTPLDNFHVTLKFLGATSLSSVPAFEEALRDIAQTHSQTRLAFSEINAFPSLTKARVLIANLDNETGELDSMQRKVEDFAEKLGFAREDRRFHAHATIARLREGANVTNLVESITLSRESFAPPALVLYKSETNPAGARYTPLIECPLTSPSR